MSQGHIKLDNPVFAGTLRYARRSVSYKTKPVHSRTVQDIAAVRRAAPAHLAQQAKATISITSQPVAHIPPAHVQPQPVQHQARSKQDIVAAGQLPPAGQVPAMVPAVSPQKAKLFSRKTVSLYAAALLIFGFGLYVGIAGLSANKKVTAQVESLAKAGEQTQAMSGSSTPPSTDKPSDAVVRRYSVAPTNPRYIDIPSLRVHARVLGMTVDKHNQLQAPYGIYDAGWYTGSAQPGQPGAMLVDGHSGVGKVRGIFHDIAQFKPGEEIVITRGDGQKFTYVVVETAVLDTEKVDMSSLLVSADTAKPGLNLITCAGDQVPGTFTLRQRAVVYAVLR